MSSIIFTEFLLVGSAENDRYLGVDMKQIETLPDYVRRVRQEKGKSLLDVERTARKAGHEIAGSYVSRIENEVADPAGVTPKKLQALAVGLEVSEEEIFAVARGKSTSGGLQLNELKLLEYFRALSEERQIDALIILEAMSQRKGVETASVADEITHDGRKTMRVRAGKHLSQHTDKALRKKQG